LGKYTLEHWRDGELFEKMELTRAMLKPRKDGSVHIIIPPGCITLVTQDEIHFDPAGLKEML